MDHLDCRELILNNVTEVALYPASEASFDRPPTIPSFFITRTFVVSPTLTASFREAADAALMAEAPVVKIKGLKSISGYIVDIEVDITLQGRKSLVERAISELQGIDFCIEFLCADGSRLLSFPLPNTSDAQIEETLSDTATTSIVLKNKSLSALIPLDLRY